MKKNDISQQAITVIISISQSSILKELSRNTELLGYRHDWAHWKFRDGQLATSKWQRNSLTKLTKSFSWSQVQSKSVAGCLYAYARKTGLPDPRLNDAFILDLLRAVTCTSTLRFLNGHVEIFISLNNNLIDPNGLNITPKTPGNQLTQNAKRPTHKSRPFWFVLDKSRTYLVELSGIEPLTSTLPVLRSPSWVKAPNLALASSWSGALCMQPFGECQEKPRGGTAVIVWQIRWLTIALN